jgi:putative transposase
MITAHDIDWPQLLAERLTSAHPDVLRELFLGSDASRRAAAARAKASASVRRRAEGRHAGHRGALAGAYTRDAAAARMIRWLGAHGP